MPPLGRVTVDKVLGLFPVGPLDTGQVVVQTPLGLVVGVEVTVPLGPHGGPSLP